MDSIIGDRFVQGRKLRPATLDYALQNYPKVVVGIKLNKYRIDTYNTVEGKEIMNLVCPSSPIYDIVMLRSDFEKCRSIATKMTIPLFPSDILLDWEQRAAAHIRIAFANA